MRLPKTREEPVDLSYESLTVRWNGREAMLNGALVRRQRLGPEAVERLKETHVERLRLFEAMEGAGDPAELRRLAAAFDALEFEQQALWGFPRDATFHRWFDVPRCTCAKLANRRRLGVPERLVDPDCPVHGGELPDWMLAGMRPPRAPDDAERALFAAVEAAAAAAGARLAGTDVPGPLAREAVTAVRRAADALRERLRWSAGPADAVLDVARLDLALTRLQALLGQATGGPEPAMDLLDAAGRATEALLPPLAGS